MDEIGFNRAAAIWATFYVKMFDVDQSHSVGKEAGKKGHVKSLKNDDMKRSLNNLCSLFNVRFRWTNHDTMRDIWVDEVIPRAQNCPALPSALPAVLSP